MSKEQLAVSGEQLAVKGRALIHLDALVRECDFFYYDEENFCNNGYNCSHPEQEEFELFNKAGVIVNGQSEPNLKKVGKCYGFSCPVAHPADFQDLKELDQDLANEYPDDVEALSSDWMVVAVDNTDCTEDTDLGTTEVEGLNE